MRRRTESAADARRIFGQLGLLTTGILSAVWALPYWEAFIPAVATVLQGTVPPGYTGNTATFLIISTFATIFTFLATRTATTGEASTDTSPDAMTRDEAWEQAPVTPRSTIAPHDELEDRSLSGGGSPSLGSTISSETVADASSTDSEQADAEDTLVEEETSTTSTDESTENDWGLPAEPPSETDAPSEAATSADLSEYSFDWASETAVEMKDVGGMDDVKDELRRDIVTPMKEEPEKAERFDIPLPNLLLHGPPGTGKTYLAKALATELGLPFVELSGSDVTSKWINASTEKVGELFDEAEALAGEAGGAVIFLDELDAVLPERSGESHEENRKVVNEFLSHLQESSRNRVLFVGATNKREDLDSAATRNGRIDKEIFIGEPNEDARREIFKAQIAGRPHDLSEDDIEELAAVTDGVVAADIEGIVNQAARNAAYGRDAPIEMEDIERQLDQ